VTSTKPSQHPLQLGGVWATHLEARRRPLVDGDPDEPEYDYSAVRGVRLGADGRSFSCNVRVDVRVPILEDELFEGRLDMVGHFVSTAERALSLAVARGFARRQALYLLWPFARGYLDQMGMMTGVGIPPLPLLLIDPRT